MIAAVVSQPPNIASERFHHAMGFEPYRRHTPTDGLERTVWLHRGYSVDLLMTQYRHAVDLYKHEDMLNWNKLNNYFYIITALTAAFGLVVANVQGKGIDGPERAMLAGFCVMGFLTSAGFAAALISGFHYLQARKAAVAHLENALVRYGGSRIVTMVPEAGNRRWLAVSPTRHLLRGAPFVIGAGWAAALVLTLTLKSS